MKVFFCGIAGTGMSALAGLFNSTGAQVYGSDNNFYPPVDEILRNMDVVLFDAYDKNNIPGDVDLCIIGNVVSRGNSELEHILNHNIEFLSMAEALYRFFISGRRSIVVAGTHGKTTITSLVAHLMKEQGLNPGYFIGGKPLNFQSNYSNGEGSYFVIEGDEYETSFFDRSSKFLKYHAFYLILSSLEYDHLDFFPTIDLYKKSFINLVNQVPAKGLIISNADFPMNLEVIKNSFARVVTYGEENGDYRIKNIRPLGKGYTFSLDTGHETIEFVSSIPGKYNIWNICPALILGIELGINRAMLARSVMSFMGVERRLQQINEIKNTTIYEDFAHHPTSIAKTISGLRESYPGKRIITLFEPRSWSLRQNYFQHQLGQSFADADEIIFKDVFQQEKIPVKKRLDLRKLKADLAAQGKSVTIFSEYEQIKKMISGFDFSRDALIIIISNGSFGGIPGIARQLQD